MSLQDLAAILYLFTQNFMRKNASFTHYSIKISIISFSINGILILVLPNCPKLDLLKVDLIGLYLNGPGSGLDVACGIEQFRM